MATDPSSIIASLLQGGANVGQSVQQGFTQGLQDQSDQQTLQLNALKIQQATQAQQQAQQQAVAKQAAKTAYDADPSPVNLNKLIEAAPDDADALTKGYQMLEAPRQQSLKTLFGQIYSAAGNQSPDALASAVSPIIAAEKAQGVDTTDAQTMLDNLQSGDPDKVASAITGAKAFSQMHLSALDPKFAESLGIGGDSNKPYTLDAGQKRFDANNNLVATGGQKQIEPFHYTVKDKAGNEHEYIYDPSSGQPLPPGAAPAPGASGAAALAPNGQLDPQAFFKQFVLPHEGGYAPHDANGAPVNMGVNQSANPGVDVSKLTPDGAAQIFATKYFPASANLPPALAAVNADTSYINPARAAQFLKASGGDPAKYMAMRQSWMNSLIQNQPDKYQPYAKAWATRNADLSAYAQNLGGGSAPSSGAPVSGGMPSGGAPSGAAPVSGGMPSPQSGHSFQIDPNPVDNSTSDGVPGNPNLTGPDYLNDLKRTNPSLGNRVQAVLDTRAPYPTTVGTRNPVNAQIAAAVNQIDPSFDAAAWKRRADTITAYSPKGPQGQSLISAATIINHMYDMAQASQNLPDHTFRFMNAISNTGSSMTNNPNLIAFNEGRKFNSVEIPKFLTGKAPAEGEIQQNYNSYDPSLGASGIKTAIGTDLDYISGRFGPLLDAYKAQTGKDFNLDNLVPGKNLSTKLAALENWQSGGKLAPASRTLGTAPSGGTSPQVPAPPVRVATPAQARALPVGTRFTGPDGRVFVR